MACQHVLCWVHNFARYIMLTHGSHLPMASIFGKCFTWAKQTITLQCVCNISSALICFEKGDVYFHLPYLDPNSNDF
jgi:hypothetical protein